MGAGGLLSQSESLPACHAEASAKAGLSGGLLSPLTIDQRLF
jgi:hypothetical protein